jgi:hypothetical protein
MRECQIYQVVEHGELRWKWRDVTKLPASAS